MKAKMVQLLTISVLGFMLVSLQSSTFAHTETTGEARADAIKAQLTKDLTLTKAQVEQLDQVIETGLGKYKALVEGPRVSGDSEQVLKKIESIRVETNENIAACLTAEQNALLKKILAGRVATAQVSPSENVVTPQVQSK